MRSQLRMVVFGVVIAVIVVGFTFESPGTLEGVGLAVVLLTMIGLILRERRNPR
jgi:hypothetical protein